MSGETELVDVYYGLQPPTIESDVERITSEDPLATITLSDINPVDSSQRYPPSSDAVSYKVGPLHTELARLIIRSS